MKRTRVTLEFMKSQKWGEWTVLDSSSRRGGD